MKQDDRKVIITHLDLSKDRNEVFAIVKRSKLLINSICQYSKELRKKGVKVYERQVNIIRTDIGYFCAFYVEDVEQGRTEEKEKKVTEFEGMDGRMKVILHDDEGEEVIKDVAEMVAKTFIDNPENHQFVKHKDGDTKNNKQENLYWSKYK